MWIGPTLTIYLRGVFHVLVKPKANEAQVSVAILRTLRDDLFDHPNPLEVPPFETVKARVEKQFRGGIPQAIWQRAIALLDSQNCLDRALGDKNQVIHIWINQHGLEVLRNDDEEIEKTTPKTNWQMVSALLAGVIAIATVLKLLQIL